MDRADDGIRTREPTNPHVNGLERYRRVADGVAGGALRE
jgi:hypothetical protein